MLFWISIILFIVTLIGLLVMIGSWVYSDAKVKSDKPLTWTLIALLTPNFFGVLNYLLVGRRNTLERSKNKFKIPLILFAVSFIISTGLFIGNLVSSNKLPIIGGVSIGMIKNNIGNQWSVSFKTSGEELSRSVNLSNDALNNFSIEGKCDEGKLYLLISQNDLAKVIELSDLAKGIIDLSDYKPGNVKLMIYNENARNAVVKIRWGD